MASFRPRTRTTAGTAASRSRRGDAYHLSPEQVRRSAAGDYVVDIYPFPVPARLALPSQDGDYWLFFYEDYGVYGGVRCFFVPTLF